MEKQELHIDFKVAKAAFEKVKELSLRLSMIENSAIRLASNIKKTQKRAEQMTRFI